MKKRGRSHTSILEPSFAQPTLLLVNRHCRSCVASDLECCFLVGVRGVVSQIKFAASLMIIAVRSGTDLFSSRHERSGPASECITSMTNEDSHKKAHQASPCDIQSSRCSSMLS